MAYLDQQAEACNYADYVEKYVAYPPNGLLPLPGNSPDLVDGCDLWEQIFEAATGPNPGYNPYMTLSTVSSPGLDRFKSKEN